MRFHYFVKLHGVLDALGRADVFVLTTVYLLISPSSPNARLRRCGRSSWSTTQEIGGAVGGMTGLLSSNHQVTIENSPLVIRNDTLSSVRTPRLPGQVVAGTNEICHSCFTDLELMIST